MNERLPDKYLLKREIDPGAQVSAVGKIPLYLLKPLPNEDAKSLMQFKHDIEKGERTLADDGK